MSKFSIYNKAQIGKIPVYRVGWQWIVKKSKNSIDGRGLKNESDSRMAPIF